MKGKPINTPLQQTERATVSAEICDLFFVFNNPTNRLNLRILHRKHWQGVQKDTVITTGCPPFGQN
ncbi:hypothetical protein GCM10019996_18330 [Lentilactobacillus parakefiri]